MDLIEPAHFDVIAITSGLPEVLIARCVQPRGPLQDTSGCALYTHPALEDALESKGIIIDQAPRVMYQDELLVQLLVTSRAHHYLEFKLVEGRADLFSDKLLSLSDKRSLGRFLSACVEAQQGYGRLKEAFDDRPLQQLLQSEGLSHQLQQVVLYAAAGLAALQLYSSSLGRYGGSGAFMAPCYGSGSLPEAFVRLAAVKGAVTALRHSVQQLELFSSGREAMRAAPANAEGTSSGKDMQEVPPAPGKVPPATAAAAAAGPYGCAPPLSLLVPQAPTVSDGDVAWRASGGAAKQAICAAPGPEPPVRDAAVSQEESQAAELEQDGVQATAATTARVKVLLASGQQLTAQTVVACSDMLKQHISSKGRLTASSGDGAAPPPPPPQPAASSSSAAKVAVARAVAILDRSCIEDEGSLLLVFPPYSLGSSQAAVVRGIQFGPAMAVGPPGKCLLHLAATLTPDVLGGYTSTASVQAPTKQLLAEQVLGPAVAALASVQGLQAVRFSAEGLPDDQCTAGSCAVEDLPDSHRGAGAAGPAINSADRGAAGASGLQQPQVLAQCFYLDLQPEQQAFRSNLPPGATAEQQELPVGSAQQLSQDQGRSLRVNPQALSKDPLLLCSAFPTGLLGYCQVVQATEALFRKQYPEVPWLSDDIPDKQVAAGGDGIGAEIGRDGGSDANDEDHAGGEGGHGSVGPTSSGAGVLDELELDAIDELTAALQELSALQAAED
eukprot:gene11353-11502_t